MSFCKFSTELVASSTTEIDNLFIDSFLPSAPEDCVKVYIYGLYLAGSGLNLDNNFSSFAKKLNMSEQDVESAFRYWEEQGLVQVLSTHPIEVLFNPLKNLITGNKLFKPEKYEVFNRQAQAIFEGKRQITKTEYGEYYDFLERSHMEQEALIMIMKYCVDSKKQAVGWNYILTVARSWANEGLLTVKQIEEKLCQMEENLSAISAVMLSLGIKRNSFIEERALYQKWSNDLGFGDEEICFAAKSLKKRGGFEKLDKLLETLYACRKFTVKEIGAYLDSQDEVKALAKSINRNLGVFYESLDSEIETYIAPWLMLGFEAAALEKVASYAFKSSIRSLEGMNNLVQKLFKLGILTEASLDQYLASIVKNDDEIKKILDKLALSRRVNSFDRENYKTWRNAWNMPNELIEYAASLSSDKTGPIQYMNRLLSTWHEKGITCVSEAKKLTPAPAKQIQPSIKGRSYTNADFQAMIQSIDEVEL